MPAKSLYFLAKRACVKNIQSITDVGDIPYDHLRPVLLKLENPHQLRELEKTSPQLVGADSELWEEFIKRDVERGEEKLEASARTPSYKLWRRLIHEDKEAIDRDVEILAQQMQSIKDAQKSSQMVDSKYLPKVPKEARMRAERTKKAGSLLHHSSGDPSLLSFSAGSKTKTMTGQGVVNRARREAKEMSLFSARKSVLATPTHRLANRASAVSSAPKSLVGDHARGPGPEIKRTTVAVPRQGTQSSPTATTGSSSMAGSPPRPVTKQPPGGYKIPRQGASNADRVSKPAARARAQADPFIQNKRRRVV